MCTAGDWGIAGSRNYRDHTESTAVVAADAGVVVAAAIAVVVAAAGGGVMCREYKGASKVKEAPAAVCTEDTSCSLPRQAQP